VWRRRLPLHAGSTEEAYEMIGSSGMLSSSEMINCPGIYVTIIRLPVKSPLR